MALHQFTQIDSLRVIPFDQRNLFEHGVRPAILEKASHPSLCVEPALPDRLQEQPGEPLSGLAVEIVSLALQIVRAPQVSVGVRFDLPPPAHRAASLFDAHRAPWGQGLDVTVIISEFRLAFDSDAQFPAVITMVHDPFVIIVLLRNARRTARLLRLDENYRNN